METALIILGALIMILGTYASIRDIQRSNAKKRGERDRYSSSRKYY